MMIVKGLILSLIFVWTSEGLKNAPSRQGGACIWNWDTDFRPEFRPLILKSHSRILLPVNYGTKGNLISVGNRDSLTFACPGVFEEGKTKKKNTLKEFKLPAVNAKCENGKIRVEGHKDFTYDLKEMGCVSTITATTRPLMRNQKCGSKNQNKYQIAFETFNGIFVPIIEFCFDEIKETTIWSKHTIHGESLSASASGVPRPSFSDPGGLFSPSMKNIYDPEKQKTFFARIMRPNPINPIAQEFFSKGHMAAKSDFVTSAEKIATFNYINVLPQWQPFNEHSWGKMERDIQSKAKSDGTDITIVTGGYDILQLGTPPTQIYLGKTLTPPASNKVPVPDILWKAVIEEDVVFVITNNPVLNVAPLPPRHCRDCTQIGWINQDTLRDFIDQTKGFTYCCTVDAFKKHFRDIKFPTV